MALSLAHGGGSRPRQLAAPADGPSGLASFDARGRPSPRVHGRGPSTDARLGSALEECGDRGMIPPRFDYARPASLDEALQLLASREGEAKVLAGGFSLLPLMKYRPAQPGLLVAIGGGPGLERRTGDFATVGVAAQVQLGADGRIAEVGLGLTAVADAPFAAGDAEDALRGALPTAEKFREAGLAAARQARPAEDRHGPGDYKLTTVRGPPGRGPGPA